eukprot:7476295-Pyramimonas_sp.AAC.1
MSRRREAACTDRLLRRFWGKRCPRVRLRPLASEAAGRRWTVIPGSRRDSTGEAVRERRGHPRLWLPIRPRNGCGDDSNHTGWTAMAAAAATTTTSAGAAGFLRTAKENGMITRGTCG